MSETVNTFRAPPPDELAPLFPQYRIQSLIATGGMGAVYHAVQVSLEREVAIKILPVEFGQDPGFCESFEAEAKAMAKLNHPNLISVFDFGAVNGMLFIVMEYVPGQSLHEAAGGVAVDPAEVIRLLTGISHGLAHAHEHGVLHRDIKPANILLDTRLQPKIGDFGLARPLGAKVAEGEAIFGTPGYTAPEVLEPPHTMDQRADIFSLGVLLRELLTGLPPGSDSRPPSLIARCDPRFDEVVKTATHPEPWLRYQNAAQIADALQKISSSTGPRVSHTASPVATRRPAARAYATRSAPKSGSGWLAPVLLVAAVAALYLLRDRIFPKPDPGPEPVPVVELTPEPAAPETATTTPETPAPAPATLTTSPEPPAPDAPPLAHVPEPEKPAPTSLPETPPTTTPAQPKFDVDAFLTHARSVMLKRCGPYLDKRNEALAKNLSDFKSSATDLIKTNLTQNFHDAAKRELDDFLSQREADGCHMGKELEKPLKFKKWLVELHQEHQAKEREINKELVAALVAQKETYLSGLNIRIKALQENDPPAAELIREEADKVNASPGYFAELMRKAARNH